MKNLVTIEIGAGTALPIVRQFAESANDGFLIRINPTGARISKAYNKLGVSLQVRALEGLKGLRWRRWLVDCEGLWYLADDSTKLLLSTA